MKLKPQSIAPLAGVLLALTAAGVQAAVIAQYDFEAGSLSPTTVNTADGYTASALFEGTEFPGNALGINAAGDNSAVPFASPVGATFNSASVTLGGGAPPADGSFDFTVTNNLGMFSITDVALKLAHTNTNPTYTVTSSVSGATPLATGTILVGGSGDRVFDLVTFDPTTVSGSPFTNIAANTPVTFTVSINATDTTGTVYIDKIELQGSAVPEPSGLALSALGLLSLLGFRRRG